MRWRRLPTDSEPVNGFSEIYANDVSDGYDNIIDSRSRARLLEALTE